MVVKGIIALVLVCCTAHNAALLFHGDGPQGQVTTLGPLGKDATLSLLVQEVLDLKAQFQKQEQEIQTLKGHQTFENNITTSTLNQLMSEFVDIKLSFGIIKQEFDQTSNLTGLQAITKRLDNMAQSIRYLTLSQQTHEIQNEANNLTVHQELSQLNLQLEYLDSKLNNTDRVLMKDVQDLNSTLLPLLPLFEHAYGIRLVNGSNSNSGRVEIFYLRQWWTVCDDNFGTVEAKVVCGMLRKSPTNAVAYGGAHFGLGTGHILFDNLACMGSEVDLFHCSHNPLGTHNCDHNEDVGVTCG